jgi:hypothetical protein
MLAPHEILDSDLSGRHAVSGAAEVIIENSLRGLKGALPRGPKDASLQTYVTQRVVDLEGPPTYAGNILLLRLGVSIYEMKLRLHSNGFSLSPVDPNAKECGESVRQSWSPFSLVEKCQVKAMEHSSQWAVFKVTIFRGDDQDAYFYFATSGSTAYEDRDSWVHEISQSISKVTMSLFPPHCITVQPVPWVPETNTRIMAGYLLRSGQNDQVSIIYCELHAFSAGGARMTAYKDEWCEYESFSVNLSDGSVVSTRKGVYCTVFGVDDHRFCARTSEEKELWLRAVSNIKVKLMFEAPDPTEDDIQNFREAVREKLESLERAPDVETNQPLLAMVDRTPDVKHVAGDLSGVPEPFDDADDFLPSERGELVESSHVRPGAPFPVPEEPTAINPTVYVTSKALMSEGSTEIRTPLGGARVPYSSHPSESVGGVPLLSWSPGRRQAANRGV